MLEWTGKGGFVHTMAIQLPHPFSHQYPEPCGYHVLVDVGINIEGFDILSVEDG